MSKFEGTVSEINGAIRGFVGLGKRGRIQDQLGEVLELHVKTREQSDLDGVRASLAEVLEHQASALVRSVDPNQKRRWNWGAFFAMLIVLVAPCAVGLYFLWINADHWATWIFTILLGLVTAFLTSASFAALVSRPEDQA